MSIAASVQNIDGTADGSANAWHSQNFPFILVSICSKPVPNLFQTSGRFYLGEKLLYLCVEVYDNRQYATESASACHQGAESHIGFDFRHHQLSG